jgi:hypothetical protein
VLVEVDDWWDILRYFGAVHGCAIFGESMRKPNWGKRIMNFGNSWFEHLWKLNGPRNLVFELNTGPPKPLKLGVGWSQPADSCRKSDSWYSLIAGKECGQTRETHLTIFCIQVGWVCPSSPNLCDGSDGSCFWHSFSVMRKEARGAWERREEEAETWLEYVRIIQYYML